MSLIEWKSEYSVGVPSIDHEHQELIELINTLNDQAREGASYDKVSEALGEIFAQISAHFALEEKIMRESRYDGYSEHKDSHEDLLDEIRDIMDRVDYDGSYDEQRLSEELEHWFGEHFRTHDARLHRQFDRSV
jgi:hemerythrin